MEERKLNKVKVFWAVFLLIAIIIGVVALFVIPKKSVQATSKVDYVEEDKNANIKNTTNIANETNTTSESIVENVISQNTIFDNSASQSEPIGSKNQNTIISNANVIDNNTVDVNTNTIQKDETSENSSKTSKTSATEGKKGVIYLTFDDGPSGITSKILDILKQENVKATFFIINYNSEDEKLVKRMYDEGHSIGIHGYTHVYSKAYQNESTYLENLNKLQTKIKKTTGETVKITRFLGGSSNTISKKYNVGLMTKLVKLVQDCGYKYYDWNVDSDDAGSAQTSAKVFKNVKKGLSKERPNVVLLHDKGANIKTVNALRDIIKYGKENGYKFEAIKYNSDLVVHHHVNN